MSLQIDDLETFKQHRNRIGESLNTNAIGREQEIDYLCKRLEKEEFIAIMGSAGVGKSRLAVASIEKYCASHKQTKVLCTKNFCDCVAELDSIIKSNEDYLIFIDNASDYPQLPQLINFLKYKSSGNIKALLTVRDYLKDCLVSLNGFSFYEVKPLTYDETKEAIFTNTTIKNERWLDQIARVSNGNIRIAFLAADNALRVNHDYVSLYNQTEVFDSFYREQIKSFGESGKLIISAGLISLFKCVDLEQLFYISPLLKMVHISKQDFVASVNSLISKGIVDEVDCVVTISDRCFADYLLDYTLIKKKHIRIKDLFTVGFKCYKKLIVESIGTLLHVFNAEDLNNYIKNEIVEACSLSNEDVNLKHEIIATFCPLIPEYSVVEFKDGVDKYTNTKDIEWLLYVFRGLALSKYSSIANEGVFKLLSKNKANADEITNAIKNTYSISGLHVQAGFKYLRIFVEDLDKRNLLSNDLFHLVSTYLNFNFNYSAYDRRKGFMYSVLTISDKLVGLPELRAAAWNYLLKYGPELAAGPIIAFTKVFKPEGCLKIIENDLHTIIKYANETDNDGFLQSLLAVCCSDDIKAVGLGNVLVTNTRYINFFEVLSHMNDRRGNSDKTTESIPKVV